MSAARRRMQPFAGILLPYIDDVKAGFATEHFGQTSPWTWQQRLMIYCNSICDI